MTLTALRGKKLGRLYSQLQDGIKQALNGGSTSTILLSGWHEGVEWHAEFFLFFDREMNHGAIFFGRDITERKTLERTLLGISDAEQHRIGGDLHDGLGQYLTGISCLTTALRDKLKGQDLPESTEADTIAGLVQEAITQTRALARGLCPVQLENSGLESALEDLAYQIQRVHGLKCNFETAGPTHNCDPAIGIHLYRIVQEATNNALKHGAPSLITVRLDFSSPEKLLTIEDDGHGFDIAAKTGPSVGLQLMNYRAGMIGGILKINSKPHGGTRIECAFTNSTLNHEKSK
jgi:signal transduction histidine kinase